MTFVKDQPKDGDTVMHCGHPEHGRMHWFQYETPVRFSRPDGTRGESMWFVACQACLLRHGDRAPDFVRGDDRWRGAAPVIKEPASS